MLDSSLTLILIRDCKSWIVIDTKTRSSAYMNELQHKDFKTQPILEFSNFLKRSSTHIANNMGDKIPPCLTPED